MTLAGPRRIVVTGATGFLGQALVEALRARSDVDEIRIVSRQPAPTHPGDRRILWCPGDVRDSTSFAKAIDGATAVFHLAGQRLDRDVPAEELRDINARASEDLARLAADRGVTRFVYFSSTGVYGTQARGRLDESSEAAPENVYERSKRDAEQRLAAVALATGLEVLALRPSNVFGPRHPHRHLLTLFRTLRRNFMLAPAADAWLNFVFIDDVIDAAVALGFGANLLTGPVVVNCPMQARGFIAAAAAAAGARPWLIRAPLPAVHAVAGLAEIVFQSVGKSSPITRRKIDELGQANWFDSARLRNELPQWPRVGIAQGLQSTAAFYRNQGWL